MVVQSVGQWETKEKGRQGPSKSSKYGRRSGWGGKGERENVGEEEVRG